jgi:hypothetical protein
MNIPIDFQEIRILIIFIFAFVGIMRGVYREGVTTIFVGFLAILAWRPETGRGIIDRINDIIKLIAIFLRSGFSLDPATLAATTVDPATLDPYSYRMWVIVTVVMVAVSYAVGNANFQNQAAPLGRIIGGILGGLNGLVLLSLVRQYLTDYWATQNQISVTGGPMSIQLTDVPTASFTGSYGIIFIVGILIAVLVILISGDRLKPIL